MHVYIFTCTYIYIIMILLNTDFQSRNLDLHFYWNKISTDFTGSNTQIRSSGSNPCFELHFASFCNFMSRRVCSILATGNLKMHNVPLKYPGLLEGSGMKYNTVVMASRGATSEKEHNCDKQALKSNEITTMSISKLIMLRSGLKQRHLCEIFFFFL